MYIMELIPIIGIIKYQYYGDNNIMIDIITGMVVVRAHIHK